jgi:hypothetical protein
METCGSGKEKAATDEEVDRGAGAATGKGARAEFPRSGSAVRRSS